MASSYHLNPLSCSPSSATKVPKLPSTSFLHTFETCGYNGISYHRQPPLEFRTYAKFDKFDGPSSLNDNIPSPSTIQQIETLDEEEVEVEEDDRCCLKSYIYISLFPSICGNV